MSWDILHPIVIHFPIALLLIAPVLVVLSLWRKSHRGGYAEAALVLMLIGTAFSFVAVSTGKAAEEVVERNDKLEQALDAHADMAEAVPWVFLVLTAAYASLISPIFLRSAFAAGWNIRLHALFLLLYAAGGGWLGLAAHRGGLLVHQLGVHSW